MKPIQLLLVMFAVLAGGRLRAATPVAASGPAQPSASAAGSSFNPQFSADGQHLVFISHANNLVTNDDLGLSLDVFVRDLVNSTTVLVSVSTNGTGGANWDANYPSISSNGQFIAFASRASNLAPGDTNGAIDVFVRDVNAGVTRLVSVDVNGRAPVDPVPFSIIPLSGNPMISGDGRWVFFESRATSLVSPGAPLGSVNIYGRDTWSNLTVLVSVTASGIPASGKCELAGLASDGGTVAFITTNTTIVAGVSNTGADVYLRQLQPPLTIWASSNAAATVSFPYSCGGAALNAGGRYVAFSAGGLTNFVFRRDLVAGTLTPLNLSSNYGSSGVQISDDGSRVLFDLDLNVFVWRQETGVATRINFCDMCSCSDGGTVGGSDATYNGYLSADGRYVSYRSSCDVTRAYRRDLVTDANNPLAVTTNGISLDARPVLSPSGGIAAFNHAASDLTSGDANGASDIFLRDPILGVTELISLAQPAKPAATAPARSSLGPNSISADGRYVVFTTYDDPSTFRDTNGWSDVVLADLLAGTTRSLTLDTHIFGHPLYVENTNAYSSPIISGNGTAFAAAQLGRSGLTVMPTSIALVGSFRNIYGGTPNGTFTAPSLSADGDLLAFQSTATDFVELPDNNNASDVFVRYRPGLTNQTYPWYVTSNVLISHSASAWATGSGVSTNPLIHPAGRWLGYLSKANDLVGNPTPDLAYPVPPVWPYATAQLVVADLGTNRNGSNYLFEIPQRLCSYTLATNFFGYDPGNESLQYGFTTLRPLDIDVSNFVFSANARQLVFGLSDGSAIYRHDLFGVRSNWYFGRFQSNGYPYFQLTNSALPGAPNLMVCTNCRNPSVNAEGSVVVFERPRGNSNLTDLFAADLTFGGETLVSATPSGAPANGSSSLAQISPDGRYVVFQSAASDLLGGDTNKASDIFVRDRWLGVTLLVSGNGAGLPGNGPSSRPVMAADGRTVVFQSFASDLVTGDYNDQRDLFVLKLGSADTDGDGVDDDWEVAYFGNLSRDGPGDFDGDGQSDRAEFLAGTSPIAGDSVFRVFTITPLGGGGTRVVWSGASNRIYRVEFKDNLSAQGWNALTATISWNGATASATDTTATTNRFYRVVRLP